MTRLLEQASRLAATREALRLQAEKVAHSYLRGPHGRRRAGAGEKFWQFRPYVAGDVPRDIDWRQTAKRDDVFVREHETEAAQALWLYRDTSASMDYSSRKGVMTKADYAEVLLLALGFLALEAGERVGILGAAGRAQSHLSALPLLQQQMNETPVAAALAHTPSRHAHIVIASDFFYPLDTLDSFAAVSAARGCRPLFLQVCDPAEEDFDYRGRVRFEDAEAEAAGPAAAMLVDDAAALRDAYHEKFIAHRAALAGIARTHHGLLLTVRTDEPVENVLARCAEQLMAGGR